MITILEDVKTPSFLSSPKHSYLVGAYAVTGSLPVISVTSSKAISITLTEDEPHSKRSFAF